MNNVSVAIITLNEEENIKDCIESVLNLSSDVVVVDCGSKDNTVKIAKGLGANVFYHDFENFALQKNCAMNKTSNKWVLALDADERIPKNLADEIKLAINTEDFSGYQIPRRNFILGAEIKYSRWSPDKHVWLWRKDLGKWVGDVHEEVIVNGKVGELKSAKIHYSHKTIKEFLNANDHYSTLEAEQMFNKKIKFSLFNMFKDGVYEFLVRFFYKKGFLDGWRGLVLSYLMFVYKITVWIKLGKLQNSKK